MTADVLVRSGLDIGLEGLVGNKPAFINATEAFLAGPQELPFGPEQVVIEVLETVPRTPAVIDGCRRLVANGYLLALDDYSWADDDPLLDLASIVKLDVLAHEPHQLTEAVAKCLRYDVQLVAEKVETRQQLLTCHELAFDLFQGYLLARPEAVEGQALSPSRVTCLRVLDKLCDPKTSAADVEDIVRSDPALSFRFLRAAGSGANRGLFRQLRSVREAVVLLGERRLRAWVMLMLLADAQDGSDEQLVMALTRARMAEQMADAMRQPLGDPAFTVGLVSALELLLEAPLSTVISELSLAPELKEALLQRSGPLGGILSDVLSWEVGAQDFRARSGLSPAEVSDCYRRALAWATSACSVVGVID